ncbi:MAG TPA: lipoate--protein ligase family protein [Actinomycetota bacterium]|nr:lipoate--protein ligase family protein [Actinomycetota bacterium]
MSARTSTRVIRLIRDSFPQPPAMDTAISWAILQAVSSGSEPETLRLHRPGPVVAFGPKDRLSPGYREAVLAASDQGFASIQRLAGGRAAVFHEDTLAFSWVIPDRAPREHIQSRFHEISCLMAEAFRGLGVDAHVGEVPGEYCPGAHSVNARGRTKLMGVGQRIVSRAAHVGGVVVVGGAERVRAVLIPVYRALGLEWDPDTIGSLRDEAPGLTWSVVERAVLERFADRVELEEAHLAPTTLAAARQRLPYHAVEA